MRPEDAGKSAPAPTARPEREWHEDFGPVLWWRFTVSEAPWCGTPLDSDWPGYHRWWTPLGPAPLPPARLMARIERMEESRGRRLMESHLIWLAQMESGFLESTA